MRSGTSKSYDKKVNKIKKSNNKKNRISLFNSRVALRQTYNNLMWSYKEDQGKMKIFSIVNVKMQIVSYKFIDFKQVFLLVTAS